MESFSSVLKNLRRVHEMTQSELADKLGVSRSAVGMYESGSREPDFSTLEAIADLFNVDTDYLLGRTNKTTYIPSPDSNASKEAAALFDRLDETDRGRILERMETMLEADKYHAEDKGQVGYSEGKAIS